MWKIKVLIQFVLAYAPGGEKVNYILQGVNKSHAPERIAGRIPELVEILNFISRFKKLNQLAVLEIGTGWQPVNTLLLYLLGAKVVYTYDHVPHVRFELARTVVEQIEKQLKEISATTSIPEDVLASRLLPLKEATNIEELFKRANIVYKAPADAAQSGLPDKSVDLVYSYAVLEHVPERVIHGLTAEAKRILTPGGLMFHAIGLHDHYVSFDKRISKVNFLKYPEWLWKFFVKNRISYHNRLREKQFLGIFESYGAKIEDIRNKIDPSDLKALETMKVNKYFADMTPEELAVNYSEVMCSFN